MSLAAIGRIRTQEDKDKQSKSRKGKPWTDKQRLAFNNKKKLMKKTRKIFNKFANQGIYLPVYWVQQIAQGREVNMKEIVKYDDPTKGMYVQNDEHKEWCSSVSKPVVAEKNGKKIYYDSIYKAAIGMGRPGMCGNIRNAIKKNCKAYGYTWNYQ